MPEAGGDVKYDHDPQARSKLNDHVCGALLQLSLGDKGSHFYASFGAPTAQEDDANRAATNDYHKAFPCWTPPAK